MLVAAALIPETALLIPGAAGAATVLVAERSAALDAVAGLVRTEPDRIVVVAPAGAGTPAAGPQGTVGSLRTAGPLRPTLAAAGIGDHALAWPVPGAAGAATVSDVGAAVGLLLLSRVGWARNTEVVLAPPGEAVDLRGLGGELVEGPDRVALLLTGSLSARRGPDGPLPDDERAAAFDESVTADLAALGAPGPHARPDDRSAATRLAAVPSTSAAELAVSAWAPWQVLLGALETDAGAPLHARLRSVSAPFGATYVVVSWEPA